MRSVVTAGWRKVFFKSSTAWRYRFVSYFRRIRRKVASQPLWRERWNWGHRSGRIAALWQNSSVTVRGSRLPSRRRTPGTAALTASSRSMRVVPWQRSRPQEEISMPVSTIS